MACADNDVPHVSVEHRLKESEPIVADHGRMMRTGTPRRAGTDGDVGVNSIMRAVSTATISNRSSALVLLVRSSGGSSPSRNIRTVMAGRRGSSP